MVPGKVCGVPLIAKMVPGKVCGVPLIAKMVPGKVCGVPLMVTTDVKRHQLMMISDDR